MQRVLLLFTLLVVFVFVSIASSFAEDLPPAVGGRLPDMKLAMPKDSVDKTYLGLAGFGSFKIPQIKAKVIIVEIFSMYCPYCQKEAPHVNQLYAKIEQNPSLKGKIKLIGIGVGNSQYEVEVFKKKYQVSFPLFADGDYVVHKRVGEVRTPYFIGVKIHPDGAHQVFYSKLGAFEGVDAFLATIVKLSGLQ